MQHHKQRFKLIINSLKASLSKVLETRGRQSDRQRRQQTGKHTHIHTQTTIHTDTHRCTLEKASATPKCTQPSCPLTDPQCNNADRLQSAHVVSHKVVGSTMPASQRAANGNPCCNSNNNNYNYNCNNNNRNNSNNSYGKYKNTRRRNATQRTTSPSRGQKPFARRCHAPTSIPSSSLLLAVASCSNSIKFTRPATRRTLLLWSMRSQLQLLLLLLLLPLCCCL